MAGVLGLGVGVKLREVRLVALFHSPHAVDAETLRPPGVVGRRKEAYRQRAEPTRERLGITGRSHERVAVEPTDRRKAGVHHVGVHQQHLARRTAPAEIFAATVFPGLDRGRARRP